MTISYHHPPPTSGLVNKYKTNQSVVSVAATDVNIVKAGLLIGRERSLFIVLRRATSLPLVGGDCVDCTIQLAVQQQDQVSSGVIQTPASISLVQCSTIQYNAVQYNVLDKETCHCIET